MATLTGKIGSLQWVAPAGGQAGYYFLPYNFISSNSQVSGEVWRRVGTYDTQKRYGSGPWIDDPRELVHFYSVSFDKVTSGVKGIKLQSDCVFYSDDSYEIEVVNPLPEETGCKIVKAIDRPRQA
jgi:hypothetical protein